MAEVDNIAVVLYHYLRLLSVKVSRSTVHRLLDTPLGDSIRGISDALDVLHVKNEVYQLPSHDYFPQLEAPFITILKVDRNQFCVVTKKDDFIVEFLNGDGKKHHTSVDKFLQHWAGTVLFGEATEKTSNEHFCVIKNILFNLLRYKFIIAILFILILGIQTAFSQNNCFFRHLFRIYRFFIFSYFFSVLIRTGNLLFRTIWTDFCSIQNLSSTFNTLFHTIITFSFAQFISLS